MTIPTSSSTGGSCGSSTSSSTTSCPGRAGSRSEGCNRPPALRAVRHELARSDLGHARGPAALAAAAYPRPCLPRPRRAARRLERRLTAVGGAAALHGADRAGILPARGHGRGWPARRHTGAGASGAGCPPRRAAVAGTGRVHRPLGGRLGGHASDGGTLHLLGEKASLMNALLAGVGWLDLAATATLTGGLAYASLVAEPSGAGAHGPLAAVIDWLHLLAGSAWLGSLVQLALGRDDPTARDALRVRALATGALALVVPAGIYAAFLHVPSLERLFDTPYGRALLA